MSPHSTGEHTSGVTLTAGNVRGESFQNTKAQTANKFQLLTNKQKREGANHYTTTKHGISDLGVFSSNPNPIS